MFFICLFFFTSLCLGLLMLLKRGSNMRSIHLMGWAFILYSISSFRYIIVSLGDYSLVYITDAIVSLPEVLAAPFATLYFSTLTKHKLSKKLIWTVLLFSVGIWVVTKVQYFIVGDELSSLYVQKVFYDRELQLPDTTMMNWMYLFNTYVFNIFIIVQLLSSWFYTRHLLKKYDKLLRDYFSFTDDKDIKQSVYAFHFLYLFLAITITASLFFKFRALESVFSIVTYLGCSAIIFYVGRTVLFIRYTIADFEKVKNDFDAAHQTDDDGSSLIHDRVEVLTPVAGGTTMELPLVQVKKEPQLKKMKEDEEWLRKLDERLCDLFEKSEPYKNPSLTLDELASILLTNRTYLSRAIHRRYNQSFSDFINSYRIQHAKQLLVENSGDFTLEQIAFESGFASYNSMYCIFKAAEGVTPTKWRQRYVQELASVS